MIASPQPRPVRRFVIVAHGRSASSVLCKALAEHPEIECHGEVFHDTESARWPVDGVQCGLDQDAAGFCRQHVWRPRRPPTTHVGFKLFPYHCRGSHRQYSLWDLLRSRTDIAIVFLERRNLLDAYVSNLRSLRSGVWHVVDDQADHEREFVSRMREPAGLARADDDAYRARHDAPIVVDPDDFAAYATATILGMQWARRILAAPARRILEMEYSDMARDLAATVSRVAGFLGAAPFRCSTRFRALNVVPHHQGVSNLAELREHFAWGYLRDFFEDAADRAPATGSDRRR